MNKIEECEKLLEYWKAKAYKSVEFKLVTQAKMEANVMTGITLALAIFKKPSNTAMQIDTTPCIAQAHSVYRINGAKYCKDCGQALSD